MQWWTRGELFINHDYIFERLTEEGGDFLAERVLSLAENGMLELGESEGTIRVRLPLHQPA